VQAMIVAEAQARYGNGQSELDGLESLPESLALVETMIRTVVEGTIDIPRIIVLPREGTTVLFERFKLNVANIHYQPVARDLLMQFLRTNEQKIISFKKAAGSESRLEDYLVRGLIDQSDISYDEHADLL